MKLRQLKRAILARRFHNMPIGWYGPSYYWVGHNDPALKRFAEELSPLDWDRLSPGQEELLPLGKLLLKRVAEEELQAVEETKQEFVCVKVNGGEVVNTFDSRMDALALVLKHAKQRKAKLQVLDSSTGELVIFTEEEMS